MAANFESIETAIKGLWSPKLVERHAEAIVLANGAYEIGDVVSGNVSIATGATPWTFYNVVTKGGGAGEIKYAKIEAQTTGIASVFHLFVHSATPTCELGDAVPNTAPLLADVRSGIYKGRIDFTSCDDIGTGMSETLATPSTFGKLPLGFVCQPKSRTLHCVLAIANAVDLADTTYLRITLGILQYKN